MGQAQAQAHPSPRQQCQVSLCVFFGAVANLPTRHTQSPTVRLGMLYVCVMSVPQATTAHGPIYPTCHSTSVSHTHAHNDSARSVCADTWKVDFCTTLSNISRLETGHVFVCVFGVHLNCDELAIWAKSTCVWVFHTPAFLKSWNASFFAIKCSVLFQVKAEYASGMRLSVLLTSKWRREVSVNLFENNPIIFTIQFTDNKRHTLALNTFTRLLNTLETYLNWHMNLCIDQYIWLNPRFFGSG